MTEEIIIDKEDKTKKHRNNEIDCLHFGCRKGENGNVLFWCDFYDDHCDNYTGCYYRKYSRLEQENKELKIYIESNKQQVEEAEMLVMDNDRLQQEVENLKDTIYYDVEKYRSALEEILESAKFAQCLPCGSGNLEDCLNCNDDTTNNGQFCMEKRIHEIKTKCVEVLNEKEL